MFFSKLSYEIREKEKDDEPTTLVGDDCFEEKPYTSLARENGEKIEIDQNRKLENEIQKKKRNLLKIKWMKVKFSMKGKNSGQTS